MHTKRMTPAEEGRRRRNERWDAIRTQLLRERPTQENDSGWKRRKDKEQKGRLLRRPTPKTWAEERTMTPD